MWRYIFVETIKVVAGGDKYAGVEELMEVYESLAMVDRLAELQVGLVTQRDEISPHVATHSHGRKGKEDQGGRGQGTSYVQTSRYGQEPESEEYGEDECAAHPLEEQENESYAKFF